MKAELLRAPVADVLITHDGQEVRFNLSYFENSKGGKFGTDDDISLEPFAEINQYWKQLKYDTQTLIFNCYKQIRTLLDECEDVHELQEKMMVLFADLMQYHTFEDISYFCQYNIVINVPKEIELDFDPESTDIIGTRERTYIREDYKQLVMLSIALRPLGAIWGEYIKRVEKEVGNVWKEMSAYYLLMKTWVLQSEPMKRLDVYINANVKAELESPTNPGLGAAIFAGIGSDDYPVWLMSLIVMKRIVFADISGRVDRSHIIQSIYGYIQSKLKNSSASFKGIVKSKNPEYEGAGQNNKLSYLECYKSRLDLSMGEVAMIEFVLENPVQVAQQLEPQIDPILVQECLESSKVLINKRLMDGQLTLVRWLMSTVIPVRIIPHLEKEAVITTMAITAAVLWYRGYKSLAALTTAYPLPKEQDYFQLSNEAVKIPRELNEQMESYYPYARRATNKLPRKKPNPGSIAITNLQKRLATSEWYTTIPNSWLSEVPGLMNNRHYSAQPDLKLRLVELVIDINERMKHELPDTLRQPHASSEELAHW